MRFSPSMLGCLLLLAACEKPISHRLGECRDLVADKEMQAESLECFTPESRPLLKNLLAQKKQTSATLDYLSNYSKLLDYKEVVGSPTVIGGLALVTVEQANHERHVIVMKRVDEEWVVDALELDAFWKPLDDVAAEDQQ